MSDSRNKVLIGLGSGRSGTASLTALIDRQPNALCFHEMNPSCAVFSGNPQPHINAVSEFRKLLAGGDRARLSIDYARPSSVKTYADLQAMPQLTLIGDIAYYYLNYIEELFELFPECVAVCMKRDRESTVNSWMKKSAINRWPSLWLADRLKSWLTRTPFYTEYNYWQEHDGSQWQKDPVWDSCFPKFEASSKREAIGMYWDYYYLEADRLEKKYPDRFRVFDVRDLSDPDGQKRILSLLGIAEENMVFGEEVHLHQS
ncbi:Uncharacterised protein [Halioglobus japonicus]|nr:Uncharacterised protein [Halioglobus japonicus]